MLEALVNALLEVTDLRKFYPVGATESRRLVPRFFQPQRMLHAVDGVSFSIDKGESIGLVGESGCGKSTIVRLVSRLVDPTSGTIRFAGENIDNIPARRFAASPRRRDIQVVFQDPTDSLNPRYSAAACIADPLRRLMGLRDSRELQRRVEEIAEMVGLPIELLSRFPHQLSGGQRARVGIGRAIAVDPSLLILDEPTSALDVSVQAIILHLLADLRQRLGVSFLFVSHDLNVVRLLCDRIVVMYLGKIVEIGPAAHVLAAPRHPYSQALVSAIPSNAGRRANHIHLSGEARSPVDPDPNVCRFYGRCPKGAERCRQQEPALLQAGTDRLVACHYVEVSRPDRM
jgi:peptide/nickel transport system ATP-binding protein